jgi:hypothetical protein
MKGNVKYMSKHVWWILPIVALLVAAFGVTLTPTLAQEEADPIEVRPDAGQPGTRFRFFATGFDSGVDEADDSDEAEEDPEVVSIWINAPDGSVTTDGIGGKSDIVPGSGRVDWYWDSPENAQSGTWSAVAFGNRSEVEQVITFEISPDAPAEVPSDPERLDANVQPNAGPGGTTFSFFATGFDEGEELAIWVNTPDGRAVDANVEELFEAASGGRADWYWTAPEDAQVGMWSMVARGKESGVEYVIPFEITP